MHHPCFQRIAALLTLIAVGVFSPPRSLAQRVASLHRPALDLFVYRRSQAPDEPLKLRLSAYNQHRIAFTVYRLDLAGMVKTSRSMESLPKAIKMLDVRRMKAVRQWSYGMGKTYPDQWAEREVTSPRIGPGIYLVRAQGGGAERRTWIAVTDIALLSRRSRQEILIYAASVHSGRPVTGLPLSITDSAGRSLRGTTDAGGVVRMPREGEGIGREANLWVYGEQAGSPAFVLAGAAPPPNAFVVYMYPDRPIYRPGHAIQYRGTVRQRLDSNAPGGFTYKPYTGREVTVEIRDSTDALVEKRTVTTNSYGTFDGKFQLASELPLGRWQLIATVNGQRTYTALEVQAYRKPEYTVDVRMPAGHITGGDSVNVVVDGRYFFGQPVANASVQYMVQFAAESGSAVPDASIIEPPFAGQGVLDSQGRLVLDIKTKRLPFNRRLVFSATVTDLSRRSRQASGSVLITAGRFHISASPEKSLFHPGDTVRVHVGAQDYDDRPIVAKVRVRLIETKEDAQHRPYKAIVIRDVITDAAGNGVVLFPAVRPGYLQLTAEAFDTDDNKISATGYVWIAGDEISGYEYPNLDLTADRTSYRPGETATVLVNTSLVTPHANAKRRPIRKHRDNDPQDARVEYPAAWALVTIEGERLYEHRVVKLSSRSSTLKIFLADRYFPSVRLSVAILQERHIYEQDLRIEVTRQEQKLTVTVAPDKEKYAPGEQATFTITTRDFRGTPVPAEVGLGVVDSAIYAIRPDDTPNPEDYFYSGQDVRIHTDFSFAAQYSGGAAQTVPRTQAEPANAPPGQPSGIRVRSQFADTAVWRPYVATGNDGTATVQFALPDNLTTWRATARGVSATTAVGTASHDVVSALPLLVRLSLPRFYVEGDAAVVSAIVHNYTGGVRNIRAHIEAAGATLDGPAFQEFSLAANAEQRLDWRTKISAVTSSGGTSPGAARFLITADGGPGGQDAAELTLPVASDAVPGVAVRADSLAGTTDEAQIDLSSAPTGARVTVTLSPSLAAATFDALDYLTSYPYGCAEQTMSAFLPDVIVSKTLARLHSDRKVHADLRAWVNVGLQKLYRYQHSDGGWNWWEFDQTDGDMTAYVLWGLVQAKDAGYLVDDQRILRGTEALIRMLRDEREWNRRADWVLTLTYARPEAVTKAPFGKPLSPLMELVQNRARLDTIGLASLSLSLARAGGEFAASAVQTAHELEAKAVAQGTVLHWPAADGGYTWRGDDAGVTAHALRALLTGTPSSPVVPRAIRWLMANRTGKAWQSTRSSAEAVFALAQAMEQTGELKPDFNAAVELDGSVVGEHAWTPSSAFDDPVRVTISADKLRHHSVLTVRKRGAGVLYSSVQFDYSVPSALAKPDKKGLAITRLYRVSAEDPSLAGTIASGEDIEVTVRLTADANYRYVLLEEPIPAGCEVAPGDETMRPAGLTFENGGGYVRQEVRDNRVIFFFSDLPKGAVTFTYRLHAETPGNYRILPSVASLVYLPEIRGSGAPVRARIGER